MCMRNAQSDVGQQAVTGFTPAVLPNRLRIYVTRMYIHAYTCMRIHVRIYIHIRVYMCVCTSPTSPIRARVPAHTYARAYPYTRAHSHTTHTHTDTHIHTHDTAILRRSANQWRNCKPVHPRGPPVVHAAWISNLSPPLIFVFPFFFFTQSPSTVSLAAPDFTPKLFTYGESGLRGGS